MTDILKPMDCFVSTIYTIEKPEFLDNVRLVSEEAVESGKAIQKQNEVYPSVMSTGMAGDIRIADFETFLAQSCWTVLDGQGYNLNGLNVVIGDLWCQKHDKYSGMEQHVHGNGALISGFYFIDTPDDSCMAQFYDPRAGKVQAGLAEKDLTKITHSSNSFYVQPKNGLLVLANSWLPHSFTRNASEKPMLFVHFNAYVTQAQPAAEAIVV